MILQKGLEIDLDIGKIVVKDILGSGGQGEVYLVTLNDVDYALKIYINQVSNDFKFNLRNNVDKGSPDKTFLWPKEVIELDKGIFGYLMDLRPSNYIEFCKYLNGYYYDKTTKSKVPVNFKNTDTQLRWCIELCKAFKKLHEKGYSYQDLNDGSFFLDPNTGDLLVCDNDNVTANQKNLGVLGKMRYMAPEIVRGERLPDIHSDRFSLAIILFLTLCYGNPFEGDFLKKYEIIDEVSDMEMYGTNPVFIYHKENKSNRPIRGYHKSVIKMWPILPIYIKEAFHRTFVDGLIERENERTTELEWIKLLTRYRDELVTCSCGKMYAYGLYDKSVTSCPYCYKEREVRTLLTVNKNKIVLEPDKQIFKTHLDKYSSEYNEVIGKVIRNKNNPLKWGIKMKLEEDIEVKDQNETVKVIDKNMGVIPIIANLTINFENNVVGKITKLGKKGE